MNFVSYFSLPFIFAATLSSKQNLDDRNDRWVKRGDKGLSPKLGLPLIQTKWSDKFGQIETVRVHRVLCIGVQQTPPINRM